MDITLNTNIYSEYVIRKSLYWISEFSPWTLDVKNNNEIVVNINCSKENEKNIAEKFNILLNDFKLREHLDISTKGLREKVITQALTKVYTHNG